MTNIIEQKSLGKGCFFEVWLGLSTDTKPSGKINGSFFIEIDTGKTYIYNQDASAWIEY